MAKRTRPVSKQREEFRKRVAALVRDIRAWVEQHDWVTKDYEKKMRDADNQVYSAPALFLQKGPTRVLLDPVAYDVPGAEGVVDVYLMPTYDDMASLYFEKGISRPTRPSAALSSRRVSCH